MLKTYKMTQTVRINGITASKICGYSIKDEFISLINRQILNWETLKELLEEEKEKEEKISFPFKIEYCCPKGLKISFITSDDLYTFKEWKHKVDIEITTKYEPCVITLQDIFKNIPADIALCYIKERM